MSWQHNPSRPLQLTLSAYEWSWSTSQTHPQESKTEPLPKNSSTNHCTSSYIRLSSCALTWCCRSRMLCCRACTCSVVSLAICLMLFRASSSEEVSISPSSDSSDEISAHTSVTWQTFQLHVRCVMATEKHLSWFTLKSKYWLMMLSVMSSAVLKPDSCLNPAVEIIISSLVSWKLYFVSSYKMNVVWFHRWVSD